MLVVLMRETGLVFVISISGSRECFAHYIVEAIPAYHIGRLLTDEDTTDIVNVTPLCITNLECWK